MHFRIAIRKNKLAEIQANMVGEKLKEIGHTYELVQIDWTKEQLEKNNDYLSVNVDKGSFIKEVQDALINDKADIAVYSMKDVPATFEHPTGFLIAAVLERGSHRDVIMTRKGDTFLMLPKGAKIGTTSVRRASQIKANFPYLETVYFRGSVDDRLEKLESGFFDAVILDQAGIERLGLMNRVDEVLESDVMMPALGQGIIGVECRKDSPEVIEELKKINHQETFDCLKVERAIANDLHANYFTPIAGYAEFSAGGSLRVVALVSSKDGETVIRSRFKEKDLDPRLLGKKVAKDLIAQGAAELIKASLEDG